MKIRVSDILVLVGMLCVLGGVIFVSVYDFGDNIMLRAVM